MASLREKEVWKLVNLPPGRQMIKTKWVFVRKPDRYKARLVVKGCSQKPGVDFTDTYASVVRLETVRTLCAVATADDLEHAQFDVKTAFLNGNIDTEIYMQQPEGMNDGSGRVCLLRKSLYGLKQAPLMWFETIDPVLRQFGL